MFEDLYDDDYDEKEAYYKELSVEELYKLTITGDPTACAYYVNKRIDADVLTPEDMKFLDVAVKTLDLDAAICGRNLYGQKGCLYEDEEKFAFCSAVLEQYGSKRSHKAITKLAKKNPKLVNETDKEMYSLAATELLKKIFAQGGCDALVFRIYKAPKYEVELDNKHAYGLTAYYVRSGVRSDTEHIYAIYPRDKYAPRTVTLLAHALDELLKPICEKFLVRSYKIDLFREIIHEYGESGSQEKPIDAKLGDREDAPLNIKLSDDRLSVDKCAHCGGAIENGVCSVCGKPAEKPDGKDGEITIHRARDMESLRCTQCGGAVKLDDDNTAFCPFCGTTFIVNGNVLDGGIRGIDFNNLKADMPEDASLPDVKFTRARICDGITTILPDNFDIMPEKYRRLKYANNPPQIIYTTPDTCVNLCFSFKGELKNDDVIKFGQAALTGLRALRKDARFGEVKQFQTRDKTVMYFDFLSAAMDQPIYNAMFFFSFNGKQALGSWNCLGKDRWFWAPIFEHAVKTMNF